MNEETVAVLEDGGTRCCCKGIVVVAEHYS
jgi:hypothetical protein